MDSTTQPLAGKVAIVAGASRGIGAITARALADAGAAVALAARDQDALLAVAGAIVQTGGQALVIPTDVSDPGDVAHLVRHTVNTYGRLDVAFNNAGHAHVHKPLHELPIEDFDAALATNVRGLFLLLREEIPAMRDTAGQGVVVNVTSTAATKHAVIGLTKVAALDHAARKIRVNAVAPGRIDRPQEVAEAVTWLCSDQASFVTGAVLPIDGGKFAGNVPFQEVHS
jgi:NAD(P)-dependent dehydrogenase (short-subunit alcohol dehydrogenase family)